MGGVVFSVIASPRHPRLSELYLTRGLTEVRLDSPRKAMNALRSQAPQWVVADFVYAYSTYYQATNVSNLDVLLQALVKYAPQAKVIVLVAREEREHVEKLRAIYPLHAVFTYPVAEGELAAVL